MERDFFGISGKESASSVKDDGRTARQDPAVFGGSAIQWPFSSKVSPVPSFMSFKAAQEQQPKKLVFDQFPSSGFQPISTVDAVEAANQKSSPVSAPQKAFNMDRQAMQQYLYAYQHQGNDSFGASAHQMNRAKAFPVVSHHPISISSPFFKLQSATDSPNITVTPLKQQIFGGGNGPAAGSVVGTFASRNMPKSSPTTAQLTIFYAGVVNVFDNVPQDKAQELMLFASKASNTTAVSASPKPASVIPAAVKLVDSEGLNTKQTPTQKQSHAAPLNSSLSSAVSVASQGGSLSKSASSSNDDSIRPKSAGPSAPGNQNETSTTLPPALGATTAATIMTRAAVPQARKASLARFLEKRKERMTNAAPYACAKKPSENADGFENSIIMPSKSSSTDITLSSNCNESWNLAQAKNSSHSADSPSTRLEI